MARILVVEDEPRILRVTRKGLEAEGHAVDQVGTAVGAPALARSGD